MNVPLITWCCIVALIVMILVSRLVMKVVRPHRHHSPRHGAMAHAVKHHAVTHGHFLEMGSERDEFFLPGDPTYPGEKRFTPDLNEDDE